MVLNQYFSTPCESLEVFLLDGLNTRWFSSPGVRVVLFAPGGEEV